jgi:hypothetical protein
MARSERKRNAELETIPMFSSAVELPANKPEPATDAKTYSHKIRKRPVRRQAQFPMLAMPIPYAANTVSPDLEQARDTPLDANYTAKVREKIGKIASIDGCWGYGMSFVVVGANLAASEVENQTLPSNRGRFAAADPDL